jgi:hypothetical protein
MKRWKLGLFASLVVVGSTACQATSPNESEATQFASVDPCDTPDPVFPLWDGSQPPVAGYKQVYRIYAPVNGASMAALVDTQAGTIPYARMVPTGKRGQFLAMVQTGLYGYVVVGGGPPTPPDVIGPTLRFDAIRHLAVQGLVAGDVQSCGPINPGVPIGPIKGGGF